MLVGTTAELTTIVTENDIDPCVVLLESGDDVMVHGVNGRDGKF